MLCFKCKTEMQKTIFEGIVIDYCSECKSCWMDKGEFERAVAGEEFDAAKCAEIAKQERKEPDVQTSSYGNCPKCTIGKMSKMKQFDIELDKCDNCDGIFFDKDERVILSY